MVKTTGIGYVVISIGTLLLGVPLAGLVALGVEHLWSGMGWLGFLAALSSWMAFGVSRLFCEHGNTDIMPIGWPAARKETGLLLKGHGYRDAADWWDYVLSYVGAVSLGVGFALVSAGLLGLLLPSFRLHVFITVTVVWLALGILAIINDHGRNPPEPPTNAED